MIKKEGSLFALGIVSVIGNRSVVNLVGNQPILIIKGAVIYIKITPMEFFERINLTYRMTFQLRRFGVDDNDGWAMEHFFRMTFPGVSERLYLSGFVDQIFDQPGPEAWPSNPIVGELQLGVRLWNRFYAIGEYRVNQKRVGDEENFAAGIEYKLRW